MFALRIKGTALNVAAGYRLSSGCSAQFSRAVVENDTYSKGGTLTCTGGEMTQKTMFYIYCHIANC